MTCRAAINQRMPSENIVTVTWSHDGRDTVTLRFTYPTAETASEALDAILMAVETHRQGSRPYVDECSKAVEPGT
mgnify:FL=1